MNILIVDRETPRIRAQRRFGRASRSREERRVRRMARKSADDLRKSMRAKHNTAWSLLERSVESLLTQHDLGRFDLETNQVAVAVNSRRIINLDLVPLGNLYPGGDRYQLYLFFQDCRLYLADHDQPAVRVRKRDHGTHQLAKMTGAVIHTLDELTASSLSEE